MIFGHLNVSDSDRAFNVVVGQQAIFEAATAYVNRINSEINSALAVFRARTTDAFKLRYYLPGDGTLQQRNTNGRYGAVKVSGSWDVAFPLRDYGAMIAGNDVDMAYMTIGELDRHIQNITVQDVNTVRREVLRALMYSSQETFTDAIHGDLLVEPLANGDAVVYPPIVGASSGTTDNHYLESGYTAANISDSNDPYETIVDELNEHFTGSGAFSEPVVCFINKAQIAKTVALTDFYRVMDGNLRMGDDSTVPVNIPTNVPGRIIGRHDYGAWVSVWDFVPANYIVGVHLGAESPLIERVDPADTGLGMGLQLVAVDEEFPFKETVWRHRFGLGCGNRLNGVVMELGNGGTYTDPTIS